MKAVQTLIARGGGTGPMKPGNQWLIPQGANSSWDNNTQKDEGRRLVYTLTSSLEEVFLFQKQEVWI